MSYRKNDPITSKIAAETADASTQRLKIIKAMKRCKKAITARELAKRAELTYHQVQRRISEIKIIKRGDVVKDPLSGRPVTLLELK